MLAARSGVLVLLVVTACGDARKPPTPTPSTTADAAIVAALDVPVVLGSR